MVKKSKKIKKRPEKRDLFGKKISITWKNLVLFLILFVFSLLLYSVSSSTLFLNLFAVLSILFGFVSFALLLVLIVFLILKASRK